MEEYLVEEIKAAKYYAISVDCAPDGGHADQLTVIIRNLLSEGMSVECF